MKHLNDAEIQEYLENGGTNTTAAHLKSCPFCQQQISEYTTLFAELGKPHPVTIPDNFSRTVVAKIEPRPAFFDMRIWQFLIPILALVAAASFTLYTTGLESVNRILGVMEFLKSSVGKSLELLSQINVDFGLLGVGLISLLLLTALDHFVLKNQYGQKS